MKLLNDTLKNERGKYSRKSVTWAVSFATSIGLTVTHIWFTDRDLSELIFVWLGFVATCIGVSVWDKKGGIKNGES